MLSSGFQSYMESISVVFSPRVCNLLWQPWEMNTLLSESIFCRPYLLPICSARLEVSLGACSKTEQDTCLSLSLQEGEVLIWSYVLYSFHLAYVFVVTSTKM